MAKPVRRIITGHNKEGKSVILIDAPCVNLMSPPHAPGLVATQIWATDRTPASNSGGADTAPAGLSFPIHPPKGGSIFRVVEFPPDSSLSAEQQRAMIRGVPGGAEAAQKTPARHFGFHKTDTIDYAIVLDGECWAMMDEGETLMKPGDVLVQRGTNHSWSNRSNAPCRIAFILIDAVPE